MRIKIVLQQSFLQMAGVANAVAAPVIAGTVSGAFAVRS